MGVPAKNNPYNNSAFGLVTWTVAAEASNVIKVTGKVKDARNRAVVGPIPLRVYLTQDTATGIVAPMAPSGTVVIAAKGAIVATITAKLVFDIVTDAAGEFDFNITDATAGNWYLAVVSPDGALIFSDVADFAQPVVVSKSPSGGTTAGGTALTITGTGFTGATGVDIGGAAATSVVVVSATSITCVTPARTAGAKAITVTTPFGVSNTDITFLYA